jgi:hypothetical protein
MDQPQVQTLTLITVALALGYPSVFSLPSESSKEVGVEVCGRGWYATDQVKPGLMMEVNVRRCSTCLIQRPITNNTTTFPGNMSNLFMEVWVVYPNPCTTRILGHLSIPPMHTPITCHIPHSLETTSSKGQPLVMYCCRSPIGHKLDHLAPQPVRRQPQTTTHQHSCKV